MWHVYPLRGLKEDGGALRSQSLVGGRPKGKPGRWHLVPNPLPALLFAFWSPWDGKLCSTRWNHASYRKSIKKKKKKNSQGGLWLQRKLNTAVHPVWCLSVFMPRDKHPSQPYPEKPFLAANRGAMVAHHAETKGQLRVQPLTRQIYHSLGLRKHGGDGGRKNGRDGRGQEGQSAIF